MGLKSRNIWVYKCKWRQQAELSQEERRDIPSYVTFTNKWLDHNNANSVQYSTDSIADSDAETSA